MWPGMRGRRTRKRSNGSTRRPVSQGRLVTRCWERSMQWHEERARRMLVTERPDRDSSGIGQHAAEGARRRTSGKRGGHQS
jgi:hypothetical protein